MVAVIGLAVSVAACSTTPQSTQSTQPTPVATGQCKLDMVARQPMKKFDIRYTTQVIVNHTPLEMLIDTGATMTSLTPATAEALHMQQSMRHRIVTSFADGKKSIYPFLAKSIELGRVTLNNAEIVSAHLSAPEREAKPDVPSGILGADMLSLFEVELDFPGQMITLYQLPAGCTQFSLPWSGRYEVIPARYSPKRRGLYVPIEIDGQQLSAIVDTGASLLNVTRDGMRRLGLTPEALANDRRDMTYGGQGAGIPIYRHLFKELRIGEHHFNHIFLPVLDSPYIQGDSDALLGVSYFRQRKVWLSYRTHQVFMQGVPTPPRVTPPPSNPAPSQ